MPIRMIRKMLGVFIVSAAVLCVAAPLRAQEPQEPVVLQDIVAQADALVQRGESARALSLLRQFVLESPDAEQTPSAYAQLSRILLQEQRLEQARLYAERIPAAQRPHDLALLLVREYIRQNDSARAHQLLTQIEEQDLSAVQQAEYVYLQAQIALQRGELMQVLVYCNKALQNRAAKQDTLAPLWDTAFEALTQMGPLAREESAFMFADTPMGTLVQLWHLEEHDPARVEPGSEIQRDGESLARTATAEWIRQRTLAWLDRVAGRPWHQRTLGVVIPLSGRYAPFGHMVRQGIELALEQQEDTNIELVVRDSRADVAHTEEVMHDLLRSQRVIAVLGPMMGETATRAAEITQGYQVPTLLLSHWEGLPQLGPYVFRHSLTAKQQAQALVGYAVHNLGLQTFAVLQPQNKLGDDFSRFFRSALAQEGAEVLYHRHYPPGSTDFRAALKPMMPPEAKEGSTEEVLAEDAVAEDLQPKVEFDALFIPDFSDTIALLAPQLVFSDIEGVQLLGINGWNSTDLLNQAGRYVRGAVFTDGFDPDSDDIFVQRFVTQYRQRYGEMPTILAAQAYDAANILLEALRDPSVTDPRLLRSLLQEMDYIGGVTGLRGFDADGEALRDIALFKFGRRHIERIDPAALQPMILEEFTAPEFEE